MLYYLLSPMIPFPLLGTILNGIYYGLIYTGIIASSLLVYKKLIRIGYPKNRVGIFVLLIFAISFPSGIISSRAANMFYYPVTLWSPEFFVEQFLHGRNQTFHAGLVLPILLISVLMTAMNIRFREGWDTIFLHIPLAHAIGRAGCFLVGCCWGNPISFDLVSNIFGRSLECHNPVPLYAVFINTGIYLILRRLYFRIYCSASPPAGKGVVVGCYLIIYGIARILMETIRTEKVLWWHMTQAQLVMAAFIVTGVIILAGSMTQVRLCKDEG